MLAIGLIGKIASGKDTAAEILVNYVTKDQREQCAHLSYSRKIDEVLTVLNMENPTRGMKQYLGMELEVFLGMYASSLTDALYGDIKYGFAEVVVVSGIRYPKQLKRWKDLIPGFSPLYIEASEKTRWQRNNARRAKNNLPSISLREFRKEHSSDTEKNIESMKKEAATIHNEDSYEDFQNRIIKLFEEIRIAKNKKALRI